MCVAALGNSPFTCVHLMVICLLVSISMVMFFVLHWPVFCGFIQVIGLLSVVVYICGVILVLSMVSPVFVMVAWNSCVCGV